MDHEFAGHELYDRLSERGRGRLYLMLCDARALHDSYSFHDQQVAPGTSARELEGIRGSLRRIAIFGEKASLQAKFALEVAIKEWMQSDARKYEVPDFLYTNFKGIDEQYENVSVAMEQFFQTAQIMDWVIELAIPRHFTIPQDERGLTATRLLVGKTLPAIYEKIFQSTFGTGMGFDDNSPGPGIRFIQRALKTLCVGISTEAKAIRSHIQFVRVLKRP